MILFYHFPDKGRREVLLRVRDGLYPMSPRDKGIINRLIRKHYDIAIGDTYHSSSKWGKSKKGKRSFSTHSNYARVAEAIKGELSDELRARVVGGVSQPLLDEVKQLSADHARFYSSRKAFKYFEQLLANYKPEGGNYSASNFHLVRRGVRMHRIDITIYFQ